MLYRLLLMGLFLFGNHAALAQDDLPTWCPLPDAQAVETTQTNIPALSLDWAEMRNDDDERFVAGLGQGDWIESSQLWVFNTKLTNTGDGIFISVADDLWTYNMETGELVNLLPQGEGGEFSVAPDNQRIAVMGIDSLSFLNLDGSDLKRDVLDDYQAIGFGEYYVYPPILWEPDSSALLVGLNSAADPYSQDQGEVTVWSVPVDGSAPSEVARFDAFYASFQFSPTMPLVAYWRSDSPTSNQRELVIARLDASEEYVFRSGRLLDFNGWLVGRVGWFLFTDENGEQQLGNICGDSLPT